MIDQGGQPILISILEIQDASYEPYIRISCR